MFTHLVYRYTLHVHLQIHRLQKLQEHGYLLVEQTQGL